MLAAATSHRTIQGKGVPNKASEPGNGEKIAFTKGLKIGAIASLILSSSDFSAVSAAIAEKLVSIPKNERLKFVKNFIFVSCRGFIKLK